MRTLTVSDPSFNGIPPMLPGAMVAGDVVDLMPTVVTDSVQESRHDAAGGRSVGVGEQVLVCRG